MRALIRSSVLLIAAGAVLAACADPKAGRPARWTPPSISSQGYESSPTFSPDGRSMLFVAADSQFANWRIMESRCVSGGWSAPTAPSFTAPAPTIEADPFFAPDGSGVYFVSARHDPKGEDFDIWFAPRRGDAWGEAERLPEPVNSPSSELLPRLDGAGRLYFGSSRPGGLGGSDIYVAERDRSGGWRVRNLGPPVNTPANEYEAEISRDGRTMVVVADRGDRSHLYRFIKTRGRWTETGRLPGWPDVFQVGPLLSPKGGKLLFAQADGPNSGEMFLVELTPGAREAWPPDCSGS